MQFIRRRDAEQNAATTPPEDEHISWIALWTVEIFLPSHIPSLIAGLRKVGWGRHGFRNRDLVAWLEQHRESTGGWASAGAFKPAGATSFPTVGELDLPNAFALALPSLVQLAPGVTAMVTGFLLDEAERGVIEGAIRRPATAKVEQIPGGYTTEYASQTKASHVGETREAMRSVARAWCSDRFPGAFSDLDDASLPVWDLVVTTSATLWTDAPAVGDSWQRLLGYSPSDRWVTENFPGLSLCLPLWSSDRSEPGLAFTGLQDELAASLGEGRSADMWGYGQMLDESIHDLLACWALEKLILQYRREFGRVRDSLSADKRASGRHVSKQADNLRLNVLPLAFDTRTLQTAAADITQAVGLWDVPSFTPIRRPEGRSPLFPAILESLTEGSKRAGAEATSTTEAARTLSDSLLASANWKTQRLLFWLSVVVAILTAATVYATFKDNPQTPSHTRPSQKRAEPTSTVSDRPPSRTPPPRPRAKP